MLRVSRDGCDSGHGFGLEPFLPAPTPDPRRRPPHAPVRAQSVLCPPSSVFLPSHRSQPSAGPMLPSSALNLPAALPIEHSPNLQPTAYSLLPTAFLSTCPSPSDRRRQSPNGSQPPERVRDRRRRRGVEGEECGGVSAGGMAVTPPGRRRAFRVRSPTTPPDATERGAEAADSRRTRTGLRALCREYPSNCCPQTDADSRLRGAGQIGICQSRVRRGVARFGNNVGACPAERPAGPCRRPRPVRPQPPSPN